jgi:hypothetical protein
MRIAQVLIERDLRGLDALQPLKDLRPDLVLVFGSAALLRNPECAGALQAAFPEAILAGCSTAGEILGDQVHGDTLAVTAVNLGSLECQAVSTEFGGLADSFSAGERLGDQLARMPRLKAAFILAQGLRINGTALVEGIASKTGTGVPLTGGLAADGEAFSETLVFGRGGASSTRITALGFGGENLRCTTGSFGGWKAFGPMQQVTRAKGNLLFELGGEPALTVYKRYLKEQAKGLPATGLLYPFEMFSARRESEGIIRTILGIDEVDGSLTLAGEIDPHGYLRLMQAGTEALVQGAEAAARLAFEGASAQAGQGLALLVSCVGRKLVMGRRVEEEVQAVVDQLGPGLALTGFYAYGEIAPSRPGCSSSLHNQTMTVTWIREDPASGDGHDPAS